MTQYAGTPKLPASIYLADASTPFNPAAITPADAACWDAIQALQGQGFYKTTLNGFKSPAVGGDYTNTGTYRLGGGLVFTSGSTNITYATARAYTKAADALALYDAAIWLPKMTLDASFRVEYRQTSATAADNSEGVCFFFSLPSCTLKNAKIWIRPDPGHGATPATMPQIQAFVQNIKTGGLTDLGTQVDGSNLVQYNVLHSITLTIADIPFNNGENVLALIFRGEAGANSMVSLEAGIPFVEFTRTELGQDGGALVP